MNIKSRRWFVWANVLLTLISFAGILHDEFFEIRQSALILGISVRLLILSIANLVLIFALKFENKKWLRISTGILVWLSPVWFFVILAPPDWIYLSGIGEVIPIFILLLLMIAVVIKVFVLPPPDSSKGMLLILVFVIGSLVLKRFYKYGTEEAIIFGMLTFGPGVYIYGIRVFMVTDTNRYLGIISLLASLLVCLISIEIVSITPSQKNMSLAVFACLVFLLTLYVLFTLPRSGFFEWTQMHKKIFRKMLIPWIFIILIISVRFLFPELNTVVFKARTNEFQEFYMRDYKIPDKNGLNPE
jgi:hypothetical protein